MAAWVTGSSGIGTTTTSALVAIRRVRASAARVVSHPTRFPARRSSLTRSAAQGEISSGVRGA